MRRTARAGLTSLLVCAALLASATPAEAASPPAAPGNIQTVALSTSEVEISWTDDSNQTGFLVSDYMENRQVGPDVRSYVWGGLSPGEWKCFKVQAFNADGYSDWSDIQWGQACTTSVPLPPAVPTIVNNTALSSSEILVRWTENSNQTGIEITDGVETIDVGDHDSYTWTGLAPGTYKCSRVRAYNAGGYSAWSGWACATTLPLPPAVPGHVQAVALSTSAIRITWTEDSNQTGFLVSDYMENRQVGPDVRSYVWGGLSPGEWKCFKVQAFNADGYSDWSDIQWGQVCTTSLPLRPAVPTIVNNTALSSSEILVRWTENSNQTGFEITDGVKTIDVGDHDSYTWTGLAPGTHKCTRVRAYNAGGYSAWSGRACATTLPLPPAVPGHVQAVPLSTSAIRITWTENSNQTGFLVTDGQVTVAVSAATRSYTWKNLDPGTSKCFQVQAFNSGGNSDWSTWVCATSLTQSQVLHNLIARRDRAGIRAWAHPLSIVTLNAAVAGLSESDRQALVRVLLDTRAGTTERLALILAMEEVLDNPQLGFYAEIWSYTTFLTSGKIEQATCNKVWLPPAIFDRRSPVDARNTVMHESLHSFLCVNKGVDPLYSGLNEGAAIWVYKLAFPADAEAGASFAEATYGTVLNYRQGVYGNPKTPDYPVGSISPHATQKVLDLFAWLSTCRGAICDEPFAAGDPSKMPWNNATKLSICFNSYWSRLDRGASSWVHDEEQATYKMLADLYCKPDP